MEIFLLAIVTFEVVLVALTGPKPSDSDDGSNDNCAS